MTTRRQPPRRVRRDEPWRQYLLPAAGAVGLVVIVGLILVILVAGGNDDDENDDDLAFEITPTPVETIEVSDDADDEFQPTPVPTEAVAEITPTPDLTEEPELTPATEPTPATETTPAPPPVVGSFGELPPGDMPSGSPADAMNLEYLLDMSLQAIPREATVYQIERRQWTADDVSDIASRLGIDADVVDQGGGSYRAEGAAGSIYVSASSVQYVRPSGDDDVTELPDNEQLIQMTRNWLTNNGLVGADIGPGQVLDRDTGSGQAFVLVKPVEPSEIISATPSAGVTIRGDGVVKEAMINWPRSLTGSTYGLRSTDELWAEASRGRHFVEINVNQLPPDFQGRSGTVTITGASLAYTIGGSPAVGQYLVPVVAFSGSARIDGVDQALPVRVFVQAVAAQAAPRG